ncbi:hypothetical protein IMZ48_15755, partial [Candidatus Bathyarchaeota archaeon]|nr:hypothetical protein [Candidatus Bathyarchaeota archaeon]
MLTESPLFSSDGAWDQDEWKNARELYKSLWPNEAIWCPWEGFPVDENGKYNGEDGE